MAGGSGRLGALGRQSRERSAVLVHVCAALPPKLAASVASAGIVAGQLTVGVSGAAWASRLRYVTETLRKRVGESMGVEIRTVRLKVVPPSA
jgi:Dna[CI] antecedent, DciA